MAKCLVGSAGGLSAEDRAKIISENIRYGVSVFEGTSKETVGEYYSDTVGIMTVGLASGAWSAVYWTGNNEWLSCTWQDHDRVQIHVLKDFIGFCRTCPTTYYSDLLPREIHHFTAGTVYNVGSTGRNGAYGVAFIKIADIEK